MLFLYVFGKHVEERLGRFRFALSHVLTTPDSVQPLVGASGAVAAVLPAAAVAGVGRARLLLRHAGPPPARHRCTRRSRVRVRGPSGRLRGRIRLHVPVLPTPLGPRPTDKLGDLVVESRRTAP
ncbi:rhomboid family intramembrane serine protease [Streptomyces sp. SID3343]|uniref:rhomboid family intramembrane serine protease n=1 Tax=Streptomyces sp. SID3343 TaxID=2690260 RepID=UPI001F19334D|nr:rhomboid family intramembrane serine protease [Streptomyces sp. SID3343]